MSKRTNIILQLINASGAPVSVKLLAKNLSVSVETIRRDLTELENKGLIYRIHGGAVSCKIKDIGHSFQTRQRHNHLAKQMIARNALDYLFEGAVIGLDASSSSWYFAQLIPDIPCTVVTNSMHHINVLVNKHNVVTIATGGVYSSKYAAFYGPLSEQMLARLHIDIGIFSCVGIDNKGVLWESNELNTSLKQKMITASAQKFFFVDSSKFGKQKLFKIGELSNMDILFTDNHPPNELQNYCDKHNILISLPPEVKMHKNQDKVILAKKVDTDNLYDINRIIRGEIT